MSGSSGSGAPPPAGVVCNSALSFVAAAQPLQGSTQTQTENENVQVNLQEANDDQADRMVPTGLKSLCEVCSEVYPDQPNPLQVTTRLKYWLGGEDPLDYISMYWNPGKPEDHIPPHWHYISFGLSDLHGDGRVHPPGPESGYGFELTFRLGGQGATPPLWPAALLQALARYVFTTGNKFCAGDHISWHRPLDGAARSRVRHLLVARDPAFVARHVHTPHGSVEFLQIVGCTGRELKSAQRSSGFEVLKLMRDDPNCGGPMLVSRTSRRSSAAGVGAARGGGGHCPLAGVSAVVRWCYVPTQKTGQPATSPSNLSAGVQQQIKETLQRGLTAMSTDSTGKGQAVGHMSTDSFEMSSMERALPQISDSVSSWRDEDEVQYLDAVHIFMNAEGASLLPLAIDGRINRGAHFTWRGAQSAVTMLAPTVAGAKVDLLRPYAAMGDWLQVLITKEAALDLSEQVSNFSSLCESDSESESDSPSEDPPALPITICTKGLTITVM